MEKLLALIGFGGLAYFLFAKDALGRSPAKTLVKGKTYDCVLAIKPRGAVALSDLTEGMWEIRDALNRTGFVPTKEPEPYGPEDIGRLISGQTSYWKVRGVWTKDEPYVTQFPDAFVNAMFYPVSS